MSPPTEPRAEAIVNAVLAQFGRSGFDMAPALPQGDAMGPGAVAASLNLCADLLGQVGQTTWTGRWRIGSDPQRFGGDPLRTELIERVFAGDG